MKIAANHLLRIVVKEAVHDGEALVTDLLFPWQRTWNQPIGREQVNETESRAVGGQKFYGRIMKSP